MEENATDSDSDHPEADEVEAEMPLVGFEDGGDPRMVVMGVEDGGVMEPEGDGDEEEEQFDITLPATHSYLGPEIEQMCGRRVLEAGWTGRVAGVAHHGAVFPGETVPMLLPGEPLRASILKERLFCLLCPDQNGELLSGLGVVCEVLAGAVAGATAASEAGAVAGAEAGAVAGAEAGAVAGAAAGAVAGAVAAGVLARAAHRVRLRAPRPLLLPHYNRMQMVEIEVLPELTPGAPLGPARVPSLDALRNPHEDTRQERVLRSMDAAGSAWPPFVWWLFDYRRLRARLADHFATLNLEDKMPVEPVSLSFWVASNLALSARDRLLMLAADNALLRLHLALRCIERSMGLCCLMCDAELARRDHMFAMSSDGVHANYTNYGGFMHDVLTVRAARQLALGPPSAEYSWFPGYCWRVAQCACGTHVGWRFDAMKRNLRPSQFFALCRNAVAPRADRADYEDSDMI